MSFLGLCSYYRRFIKDFATVAKPLRKLTEKDKTFAWSAECQESFDSLKRLLATAPVLHVQHPDFSKPFILDTDASDSAIGAVLSQKIGDKEFVISYASKSLSKADRRYCVTRKELYAVVYFTKYFKHHLVGKQLLLRTDQSSIR